MQTLWREYTPRAFTDDAFAHAYQVGYLQFKVDHATTTPSAMDIYALVAETITNVHHSGCYLTGYITGWIAALVETYMPSIVASSVPHVQPEEVTL